MSEETKRLTLDELKQTQEYQRLTQKQQLFVATYCEAGLASGVYDQVAATRTAYTCKTPESARVMSYSLMANIRIVAVLNRHFQITPTEDFLRTIDRAILNKKLTSAQLGALKLKCEVLGLTNRLPVREDRLADTLDKGTFAESRKSRKKKALVVPEESTKTPRHAEVSEYEREAARVK